MTPEAEAKFEAKAEKMLNGQREIPPGRDFMWDKYHMRSRKDRDNYRKNFDLAFPDSPGAGF